MFDENFGKQDINVTLPSYFVIVRDTEPLQRTTLSNSPPIAPWRLWAVPQVAKQLVGHLSIL